jgi:cytochrome c oxidase subunit 4
MSEAREAHALAAPAAEHGAGTEGRNEVHHEPLPISVYLGVAAALFVLTGVTVGVAQFHFGEWNVVVAMLVASVKASLVVLYFMNLKHDHDRMNRVVFFAAILFLVLYATLTLADQFTRGRVDAVRGQKAPVTARFATPEAGAPGAQPAGPGQPAPAAGGPAGK